MANKPAAEKHIRASHRRRLRNKPVRTRARGAVRDAIDAIDAGEWDDAEQLVKVAVVALDRAAQKGVIHAGNAARRKSRL
ncbi:MAG: 30S ribosomal protein S20, partial [Dehalococcoidia bacterium]